VAERTAGLGAVASRPQPPDKRMHNAVSQTVLTIPVAVDSIGIHAHAHDAVRNRAVATTRKRYGP